MVGADVRESRLRRGLRPLAMPAASLALRRAKAAPASVEAAVERVFAFDLLGLTLAPQQVRSELVALLRLVAERRPRTVLEIGAARGGTLFLFSQFAHPEATLVTLDIGSAAWRSVFYRSFATGGQKIRLVRGDSHAPATIGTVRDLLAGSRIDFLFIDGDHSYEGVKQDFSVYAPLVADGGLIALHDIVPGPTELVGGVPRFWSELKESFETQELVDDWAQGGFGIGVLSAARSRIGVRGTP